MFKFNGLTFARNKAEMVNSLFASGGTCAGFYKRIRGGFQLFNLQRELFAFVDPVRALVVSAGMHNGRAFYMFSTSTQAEQLLQLPESYTATRDACAAAAEI